jgi:hypothetical protein
MRKPEERIRKMTKNDEKNENFRLFRFLVIFRFFRILSSTSIKCPPTKSGRVRKLKTEN